MMSEDIGGSKDDGFTNRIARQDKQEVYTYNEKKNFHDFWHFDFSGKEVDSYELCKGAKAILIVNFGPIHCGFTKVNMEGLNQLYEKYKSKGL